MKKMLLVAFVLIISACSKSDDSSSENSSSIYGKWQIYSSVSDGYDDLAGLKNYTLDIIEFKKTGSFNWKSPNLDDPDDESLIDYLSGPFLLDEGKLTFTVTLFNDEQAYFKVEFIDVIIQDDTLIMVREKSASQNEEALFWKRIQ